MKHQTSLVLGVCLGCRVVVGREADVPSIHCRGSEGTHVSLWAHNASSSVMHPVVGCGGGVGCGCVLFEKCIVDASIFIFAMHT